MWKQLFDFGKQLFSLTQETRQNKAEIAGVQQEIKEVREELRNLTEIVQQLGFAQQPDRENEAHEREKLVLRLENSVGVLAISPLLLASSYSFGVMANTSMSTNSPVLLRPTLRWVAS
jgi:hypothetical protein